MNKIEVHEVLDAPSDRQAESGSSSDWMNAVLHVDDCVGVLSHIPRTFDFGTVSVGLTTLAVSPAYLAIGSDCGALFLFNRSLKRSVRPLRTNYHEVVTCCKLFHSNKLDMLAIGHKSGTIIVLQLPSFSDEGNKQLKQTIQDSAHEKKSVACLCWSADGRILFSGDASGKVIATTIEFVNDSFNSTLVSQESSSVMQLTCGKRLAVCTGSTAKVFDRENGYRIIFQHSVDHQGGADTAKRTIAGHSLCDDEYRVFFSDGRMLSYNPSTGTSAETCVAQTIQTPANPLIVNGSMKVCAGSTSDENEFSASHTTSFGSLTLLHSRTQILATDGVRPLLTLDLTNIVEGPIQITCIDAGDDAGEMFLLCNYRRLLRVAPCPAPMELTVASADSRKPIGLISSLANAAQKSTDIFTRITSADNLGQLSLGQSQTSLMEGFTYMMQNPEETGHGSDAARISNTVTKGITGFVNQLKRSPPFADTEHAQPDLTRAHQLTDGETHRERTESVVTASTSSQFDDALSTVEENPQESIVEHTGEVEEVKFSRRVRAKKKRSKENTPTIHETVEETSCTSSGPNENVGQTVPDADLQQILGIIGVVPLEESSDNQMPQPCGSSNEVPEIRFEPTLDTLANDSGSVQDDTDLPRPSTADVSRIESTTQNKMERVAESEELDIEKHVDSLLKQVRLAERQSSSEEVFASFVNVDNDSDVDQVRSHYDPRNADYTAISRLLSHRSDVWNQVPLPFVASSFDVSSSYVVFCPQKSRNKPHYRVIDSDFDCRPNATWTPLTLNATSIHVNDAGNLLWRVESGIAYAPLEVDPASPFADTWTEQANEGNVLSVALSARHAWYITTKGVYAQLNLPEMGIIFHAECPFELTEITASEHAVWTLRAGTGTLVVRTGLKHCPMGVDWVEDSLTGPKTFVSIALLDTTGFGLDHQGNLWFNNGVDENNPFGVGSWYRVCSPFLAGSPDSKKFLPVSKWRLRVSTAGVFINIGKWLLVARQPLTGHVFCHAVPQRMSIYDNFGIITASGFCGASNDCIFLCQPNTEIFAYSTMKRMFISLPPFGEELGTVIAMSATREKLYVLDSCGTVHVREGLSAEHSRTGLAWHELSTEGLAGAVISIAASTHSLWAITSEGEIWFTDAAKIAWIKVDRPRNASNEKVDQVRSSPSGRYVWIFAPGSGRSWARTEITDTNHKGKSWSEAASDVKVTELAAADNAVWCLEGSTRKLHRLRGLSLANPAGLYWKPFPERLRAVSVDAYENRLWGLDMDCRLVRHQMEIYPRKCLISSQRSTTSFAHSIPSSRQNERKNDGQPSKDTSDEGSPTVSHSSWSQLVADPEARE